MNTDSAKSIQNDSSIPLGKSRNPFVDLLVRLVREKPLGLIGGIIVAAMIFIGVFAGSLAPHNINAVIFSCFDRK